MKRYKDSTLLRQTKKQLVEYIRCLEQNNTALEEMNRNQLKLLEQYVPPEMKTTQLPTWEECWKKWAAQQRG